ncbi:MAG: TetR/AcrR family transcriptional regulator [Acidobacteria bacterium]|nr:TetR/AcrR family transcriptional regulator [Acidobacteriota bacterium]MCB9398976.1 TetR/AcrR family transcriptional regulator [Acidobacteriota bacterium]
MKPGRKRDPQLHEARKQQILLAARILFTEKGFEQTSVQDVVRRAGSSTGNLYFYFPNKEALLQGVTREIMWEIRENAERLLPLAQDGWQQLAYSLWALVQGLYQNAGMARTILNPFSHATIREETLAFYRQAMLHLLESHPDWAPQLDPQWVTLAFQGGLAMIFEKVLFEDLSNQPESVWRFIVLWNFRALGCSDPEKYCLAPPEKAANK